MNNLRIMVTGARGFVGSAFIKHVMGIPTEPSQQISILPYDLMDGCDIRDWEQLNRFVAKHKPNRILHLAAVARFADADKDPLLAYETNIKGTEHMVELANRYHIPLVHISTGSAQMPILQKPPITEDFPVRGNSVYGCTKAIAEKLVAERCTAPWIVLRLAHLYGKEKRMHGLIGGFLDRINRGLAPVLYGGAQGNDFCYINDVAHACYLAISASSDKWRNDYNIGTGEMLTAEQAGKMICSVFGYKGKIEKKEQRTVDPDKFVFSTQKAETMLGFKAEYSFLDGLVEMANEMGYDTSNIVYESNRKATKKK